MLALEAGRSRLRCQAANRGQSSRLAGPAVAAGGGGGAKLTQTEGSKDPVSIGLKISTRPVGPARSRASKSGCMNRQAKGGDSRLMATQAEGGSDTSGQHDQRGGAPDCARPLSLRDGPRPDRRLICILIAILAVIAISSSVAEAVDCFKCSSRNGSNLACEDPFHNLNTTRVTSPFVPDPRPKVIYHTPCYAARKGRDGLFPASACIKVIGTFDLTGETLVVRHCALDSGTLTQDTELGCVLACPEDSCNFANKRTILLDGLPVVASLLGVVLANLLV